MCSGLFCSQADIDRLRTALAERDERVQALVAELTGLQVRVGGLPAVGLCVHCRLCVPCGVHLTLEMRTIGMEKACQGNMHSNCICVNFVKVVKRTFSFRLSGSSRAHVGDLLTN